MKREASPIVVAVGILALLVAIEIVYWQKLGPAKPRVTAATTQGGGGSRGGSRSEAPSGDPRFTVFTLAGAPEAGHQDGTADAARFDGPADVAVASDGTVYVADSRNHAIRKITPTGTVTTVVGGPGTHVLAAPAGVEMLADGALLVADTGNHRVCRVADGRVTFFAGAETPKDELGRPTGGYRDGPVAQAQFRYPVGLAEDMGGAVYVADSGNHCVRRIANGVVSTVATGGGRMDTPTAAAVAGGTLYVTDAATGCVWSGPTTGPLTRVERDGLRKLFAAPSGVIVAAGIPFIADARARGVYALVPEKPFLLAGQQGKAGADDGGGDEATFAQPAGLAGGPPDGVFYVADFGNNCIRRVTLPRSSR